MTRPPGTATPPASAVPAASVADVAAVQRGYSAATALPLEYQPRSTVALLEQRATADPEHLGFIARFHRKEQTRRVTFREWEALSAAVAGGLAARFGVQAGAKVAWVLDNRCAGEALVLYHAVHRLGAVNVPINARSAAPEVEHVLRHSEASVCIFDDDFAARVVPALHATIGMARAVVVGQLSDETATFEHLLSSSDVSRNAAAVDEGDVAILLYTSGTTGRPKGVLLTHANVIAAGIAWADALRLGPDDVFHAPFPVFSGAGLHYTAMASLFSGAGCILDEYETTSTLQLLEREGTTVFAAVPSIYQFWLESPLLRSLDTRRLRLLAYGGASMPPATIRRLRDALPTTGLVQTYGLTEAGPGGTYLPEEYCLRFLGSIGTRAAGRFTQVRVVDELGADVGPGVPGELVLRGPSIMREYYKDPDATRAAMPDGWLRTGDVVQFDEFGAMYHLDRKKDLIVRGGFNVSSVEVESVLMEHDDVLDAAVVGVPHEKLGEDVVAMVVLRPSASTTEADLVVHCRARLADFKAPRRVRVRASLPRNAAGKVQKTLLRDWLRDEAKEVERNDG